MSGKKAKIYMLKKISLVRINNIESSIFSFNGGREDDIFNIRNYSKIIDILYLYLYEKEF